MNLYRLIIEIQEMDMSGGDNIDGPRWTGKWVPAKVYMTIVAPASKIAREVAKIQFHRSSKPRVLECKKLYEVNVICTEQRYHRNRALDEVEEDKE